MPVLSELPPLLAAALSPDAQRPPNWRAKYADDVERWLSQLAEPPPWRRDPEAAHDRAAALEVSEAIAAIVRTRQEEAHQSPCPTWLTALVTRWNNDQLPSPDSGPPSGYRRTAVITLNYDTLVERAYMELSAPGTAHGGAACSGTDVLIAPLVPFAAIGYDVIADRRAAWFQLLKLHGSVDWYHHGPESANPLMYCDYTPRRWDPSADPPALATAHGDPRWAFLTADKVPFIVPPTAVKTRFYGDAVLRAQWREAAVALRSADELVLMGFSLPATDSLIRELLVELPSAAKIVVVDNEPTRADHIGVALGRSTTAFPFTAHPIREWVDHSA